MLYETDYWFWKSSIPSNLCDDIVQHGLSKQESKAWTGTAKDPTPEETADKIRQSNVSWLDDRWIYDTIQPYVTQANESAGWNFDWDYSETIQFTKYKLNQFYDWHKDSFQEPFSNSKQKMYFGKIRKLSVTCLLSDPKDYEGGDLEFQPRDQDDPTTIISTNHIKKRGTIIVFPSYTWHRVTPVTKGSRYSLVIWNLGKPYK